MKSPFLTVILAFLISATSYAWHDNTHMAIAKAAGFQRYYTVVGPDITKLKSAAEQANHWYDAPRDQKITPETVTGQISKYDSAGDDKGHLLGAIVASFRMYLQKKSLATKDSYYYLAFVAHYCGDLSMPLHVSVYDDFNRQHHQANDGIIEDEVFADINKISITKISIKSEDDIIREIAIIAESSRLLGYKLRDENRDMTKKEAYAQVSKSASLLKALMDYSKTVK